MKTIATLRQQLDDWRVQQHFKRVEIILRDRDVSHLSPALQASRSTYLNWLHEYAGRGIFPRNYEREGIAPCFIDRDGRECAVAHLVMRSGRDDLAHKIAIIDNYATVPQMNIPELDAWGDQAGLSKEELTLIQPGYSNMVDDILPMIILGWAAGVIPILINVRFARRKYKGIIIPIIGLLAMLPLLWLGINCFLRLDAAIVSLNDGFAGVLRPYHAVLLAFFAIGSLVLALLTTLLSVYRIGVFFGVTEKTT